MKLDAKQRFDFELYNDANAFSVVTRSGIQGLHQVTTCKDQQQQLQQLSDANQAVVLELDSDSPVNIRLVVDDELTDEEQQWVGHAIGLLDMSDGRCVLSGGFEPSALTESLDEDQRDQDLMQIELPSALYRVDVYTYLPSPNLCIDIDDGLAFEKFIVDWFKRDHPETPAPYWMEEIVDLDVDDVELEDEEQAYIDFLLQFTPLESDQDVKKTALSEAGLIASDSGKRRPERFPLGIRSEAEAEEDDEMTIADLQIATKSQAAMFLKPQREVNRLTIGETPLDCEAESINGFYTLVNLCIFPNSIAIKLYDFNKQHLPESLAATLKRQKHLVFRLSAPNFREFFIDFIKRSGNECKFELISIPTAARAAGPQLYGGEITNGGLRVSTVSVPVTSAELAAALDLFAQMRKEGPMEMESEDACQQAIKVWKSAGIFRLLQSGVKAQGAELHFNDRDIKMQFVTTLFKHRYSHIWETTSFDERREYIWALLGGDLGI